MSSGHGSLQRTPLHDWHIAHGAKIVAFAGYEMPVQYTPGVLKEHLWTREKAGLFDVSHMGQAFLKGADHAATAAALERLVPADIAALQPGQQRYTQLLDDTGGILDDLMVTRSARPEHDGKLLLIVNAGCKQADYVHIAARIPAGFELVEATQLALIALQGPGAARVVGALMPQASDLPFMAARFCAFGDTEVHISRSGYTGEDGYEISVPADKVVALWDALASHPDVQPIGLGARDSLRLEAGLCLYGHDIDTTTSPIEAGLAWSIQKRRRLEGGFPGAARIQRELAEGPLRRRVGIRPEGKAPAREGTEIRDKSGALIGTVTSGGFGPSANGPVAMGYVAAAHAKSGTPVDLMVRGKPLAATVVDMPFVPHRYVRKT